MLKSQRIVLTTALFSLSSLVFAQNAAIKADFSDIKTEVSKNLYGIFYEDINFAADGGLYGEMVQNRSFEFQNSKFSATDKWTNVSLCDKSKSRIKAAKDSPLNANNPVYATITVKQAGDGICNKGYTGMYFEKGKTYPGSVYLRSPDGTVSSITITIGDSKTTSSIKIDNITTEWKKYTYSIEAAETTEKGSLCLYADQEGTLNLDMVSLFRADIYKNEPNGLRADLVKRLEDLHPAFIRFPGGCIVHGLDLQNAYNWKDTIGPVEERKENMNFWGYQQSYGLGFYEYFRLCEDLGAEPLPVLRVGMAHNGERDSMDNIDKYVQDALDLIEWATGSATSTWGKKRAEAGHPAPFKLTYLGIGNEDCGEGEDGYSTRFKIIAQAVKAKYPNIKTVMSTGFTYNDVNFHTAWQKEREWEADKSIGKLADLMDEHYYNQASWFLTNGNRYDDLDFYPRDKNKAKVFIGEYASWDDNRKNSAYAAITEAAYMTSIERNGDIVEIASYAPLFAYSGRTQWEPDMIYFDQTTSYGTPNYYVQQMFMNNKSDKTVKYSVTQPETEKLNKYIGGTIGLATWSTVAEYKDIKVTNNDTGKVVYDSNGKNKKLKDFRIETGSWSFNKGVIRQDSNGTNLRAILDNEKQMEGVQNYTLELKAQKISGDEGFLIMFGVNGKKLYWWNLGGWANTQCAVEKGTADGRNTLTTAVANHIDTGRWYDIKIEVAGESFRCYLDGKLIHEYCDKMNFDPIYAHVGETDDGKVIVKVVNASETEQSVAINLDNVKLEANAKVITLSGNTTDENSFANPLKVAPVETELTDISNSFNFTAKPTSCSVIIINKK